MNTPIRKFQVDYYLSRGASIALVNFGVRFSRLDDETAGWCAVTDLPTVAYPGSVSQALRRLADAIDTKEANDRKRREDAATPVLPGIDPKTDPGRVPFSPPTAP